MNVLLAKKHCQPFAINNAEGFQLKTSHGNTCATCIRFWRELHTETVTVANDGQGRAIYIYIYSHAYWGVGGK